MNLKDHEREAIYLVPTGNNARRCRDVKKATLCKVSRVYCDIVFEGSSIPHNIKFKGNSLWDDCNSGYVVHLTMQSVIDERNKMDIARVISDNYRYASDYQKVSLEALIKVAEILELDISFVDRVSK